MSKEEETGTEESHQLGRVSRPTPPFTSDEVTRFLGRQGVGADCPACGKNEWNLTDDLLQREPSLISVVSGAGIALAPHRVPLIVMTCMNCAHVRLFSWKYVRDGIVAMRKADQDG